MSNSGSRHASSSTHAFPLDNLRVDGRPRGDPQTSWSRRLGESSRPRRASTVTWTLPASDNGALAARDASRANDRGSDPRRSSSSREIPAPESHNLPTVASQNCYDYEYDEYDDVLNSPTPSSPSAKSLSLAPSEDHVQLARAAALARSISKQRAAGLEPPQPLSPPTTSAVDSKPLGSWWAFLPGAAADGSRVGLSTVESDTDGRRPPGADVGPSTSLRRPQVQTFGPRAHPAGAAVAVPRFPPPIDGRLTDGSHSQTGHRDVGEQLRGWRLPPRPGLPGARAHGDSPGCARPADPDKALARGLWNSHLVPAPSIVPRLPSLRVGAGPGPGARDRSRADEYARRDSAPALGTKRAPIGLARPHSLTVNLEAKIARSSASARPVATTRASVQRASLVAAPSDAGAGVLHSEEGLSTESERRALYQFDQLMLARGLVGVFKLGCLQRVVDDERYWQFKCTLLVMEPYPSETCVYRGARVTRATRIEARAAAARHALSALSLSPVASELSPLAPVPDTPCPPYRRNPPSPELVLPGFTPETIALARVPPSLVITRDELEDPSETYSVGTHTPSHGSMTSLYELVYDDPDLLLLDQSQMPRSVSANAASRLEWPGDPPPDSDYGDTRHRPVSR